MSLASIPQEMLDAPRWGVWRAMTRDGRLTKIPYSAVTGKMARSNVIEDWCSFDVAQAFKAESPLNQGLGFCLGDGWAGVDLDGCFDSDTGTVAPEAEAIIESFETYTEVSPSGTGFKLFMHGSLAEGTKGARIKAPWTRPGDVHGDIEVYSAGRYFTVTGEDWGGFPIQERSGALQELQQRYFLRGAPNTTGAHPSPPWQASQLQDEDLWQRMFKWTNGGRIRALYDGDHSAYTSKSEADSALCCDLVFATNHDAGRVARMFAQSALADKKWERQDYRELTIGGAMAVVTADYRPGNGHQSPPGEMRAEDISPPPVDMARPEFWAARPELEQLFGFALAHRASPWGVLGCVMARVIASTPYDVVLPNIIGDIASLNLFVGLVAPSGHGKGACERVAALFLYSGNYRAFVEHRPGSGQGLAHAYAHREKEKNADGKQTGLTVVKRDTSNVLFRLDEVDTLRGLVGQSGSTLMAELRGLAMGERLGHMYVDPEKRIEIEEHTYRGCLIVGIQPDHADVLLDDTSGGTPQRFLWLPATYPLHPDQKPVSPPPLEWSKVESPYMSPSPYSLPVWQGAVQAIDSAHLARSRGEGEALDGHILLMREKVAAALSILSRRMEISQEDWELAGIVMEISDQTRAHCIAMVKVKHEQKDIAWRNRQVETSRAISEAEEKRLFLGAQRQAVNHVIKHMEAEGCTRRCIHNAINSKYRAGLDEVLADAVARQYLIDEGEGRWMPGAKTP